jgi:hypothetical protein
MEEDYFITNNIVHYLRLYILRLNGECTDVDIEQYQISKYPNLEGVFDCDKLNNEREKEKLVEMDFGKSRIVEFSTHKDIIERDLKVVRQSLKDYHEIVTKANNLLKSKGYDSIRLENSKKNLDVCSFSDTFFLYDRPLIKFIYRLGNKVRIDGIATEYEKPCWTIYYLHSGGYFVYQGFEEKEGFKTIDECLNFIIKEPQDFEITKNRIVEQVENDFDKKILPNDILYDPVSQCYLFKENTEKELLKDLMPERDTNQDEIAKYTTLETLTAMLQSGKIRMNSIVSMNDKTETDFLEDTTRNYKEDYERDNDKCLFADKDFITSFTTKIDDLDMWRLYGDNAKGVCMVFKRKDKEKDGLYKIRYIDPDKEPLKSINSFTNNLKSKGIRFHLWQLHKYCHFIKHSDYSSEEEYRLLERCEAPDGWFINRDNGILTPYIEKDLEPTRKNNFPFQLDEIILGPAMRESKANQMQIFYLSYQYENSIKVSLSMINSYR